jgi:transposase
MAVEYHLHALECPHCHATTRAELPPGVPWGNFGPRLQAFIAVCAGAYRLSSRMIEQLVADIYDVDLALGTVVNLEQQTSEALAVPVAEAAQHIQTQPVVHADETSWHEAKKKAWLWVVVTTNLAVFLIRRSRGADVAKELLGELFRGLLVTDRWAGYNWLDQARRQLCWAHLLRQFVGFEDHGGRAKLLGMALQHNCRLMFGWWHRVRDGTLTRATLRRYMRPVQQRILHLLAEGERCGAPKVAGRCKEILKLQSALFTFVRMPGVEPTNNVAERAIRHAVLWRKSSYGTDSEDGSTFVARILTVVTSLRLQHRHVLDWVTEACEARLARRTPPSLLRATHKEASEALAA